MSATAKAQFAVENAKHGFLVAIKAEFLRGSNRGKSLEKSQREHPEITALSIKHASNIARETQK